MIDVKCPQCGGCGIWTEPTPTGPKRVVCKVCYGEGYILQKPEPWFHGNNPDCLGHNDE